MNNVSISPLPEKERPPAANQAGLAEKQTKPERSATPRKWQRVLHAFVDGRSLNRFEAARELRDWCLNTTVSQLEQRGVVILRRDETVPGAFGTVHCCRYWISPDLDDCGAELLVSNTEPDALHELSEEQRKCPIV